MIILSSLTWIFPQVESDYEIIRIIMWPYVLTVSILLLDPVSAGVLGDGALSLRRDGSENQMRRYVDSMVKPEERRQMSTMTNLAEWDTQTAAACTTALAALNEKAGNPSGMAACYNLPYLNNSTGVFQSDLRLFTVSAPSGTFVNIPSQNVMVGLSYVGATVSMVNASTLIRRDKLISLTSPPQSADRRVTERQAPVPVMAQTYAFIGQIDKDLLIKNMDRSIYL